MRKRIFLLLCLNLFAPRAFAQAPGSPPPAPLPDLSQAEQLFRFDTRTADVQWSEQRWQLVAGGRVLKDFGRREMEARQALRAIRDLGLSEYGTVGSPRPVMEYWLAHGQGPQGTLPGLRSVPFDPQTLHVAKEQDQWCVRDDRRVLFTFGSHAEEAQLAEAVIRQHQFSEVAYIGQPTPSMLLFLANPSVIKHQAGENPAHFVKDHDTTKPQQSSNGMPALADMNRGTKPQSPPPPLADLPLRKPLGYTPSTVNLAAASDRVPFDWRQVRLQHENGDWKLLIGGYALATFGGNEPEARQALAAMQFYRFTEQCLIGKPKPTFSYFLIAGQAPRGLMFGVPTTPFRSEEVVVKQINGSWVLHDGQQVLLDFGDKADEAQQALQAIQRFHVDHLCRVGNKERGMTFFVRVR
jgi:hypothetical protein